MVISHVSQMGVLFVYQVKNQGFVTLSEQKPYLSCGHAQFLSASVRAQVASPPSKGEPFHVLISFAQALAGPDAVMASHDGFLSAYSIKWCWEHLYHSLLPKFHDFRVLMLG